MPAEESVEFREVLENDMIYLGTFGFEDPMTDDVKDSIDYITHGHPDLKHDIKNEKNKNKNVTVRLVSGDHVNTAMAVAYEAGILDKDADNIDLD